MRVESIMNEMGDFNLNVQRTTCSLTSMHTYVCIHTYTNSCAYTYNLSVMSFRASSVKYTQHEIRKKMKI